MFRSPQVVLFSADVSRAAAFYEALGFTETRRVPVDGEPIHMRMWSRTCGCQLLR